MTSTKTPAPSTPRTSPVAVETGPSASVGGVDGGQVVGPSHLPAVDLKSPRTRRANYRHTDFGDMTELRELQLAIAATQKIPAELGHIYVVEFATGIVKVGKTSSPTRRIRAHGRAAAIHGTEIANCWISQPHQNWSTNERQLIQFCASRGTQVAGRGEYFRGVSFADASQFAEALALGGTAKATA